MTVSQILTELEALGTAQTLKTYRRHGLTADAFGVKYGDLEKLARRLKKQPELALELWASGNHDARILATKIADPAALTKSTLNKWAKDVDGLSTADFASMIARGPLAVELAGVWTKANPVKQIWKNVAGWSVVAALACRNQAIEGGWFESFLTRIENEIKDAPNWVRYSMNGALIAIGGRDDAKLRDAALKIAKRIGKVEVDHGDTSCKTPDAAPYIKKMWERRKAASL